MGRGLKEGKDGSRGGTCKEKESRERNKMVLVAETETKQPRERYKMALKRIWRLQKPFFSLNFCLPQLMLNFYFAKGNFSLLVTFGSFEISIETGIPFSFASFRAMVVKFGFKKSKFGDFNSSP